MAPARRSPDLANVMYNATCEVVAMNLLTASQQMDAV
jgi:hypothetical protein